jgi:acetylornithine/N-succinyldiaminopimelate aminotransferase
MFLAPRPDRTFVRGEGSWLFDAEGRHYLDFVQGWAVNSLGHSSPIVRDGLQSQAARVINVGPGFFNGPMCGLAETLANLTGLQKVFFANSGAEANEGAVKLARKWGSLRRGGAYEIVVFEGAFHGRTLAMMSASDKPQWKDLYEPKVSGFVRVRRENIAEVRNAIGPNTAAVLIEPIQGESGVVPFSKVFLQDLRSLTEELGILLLFDEIQTGIGRTGRMFCFEHAGILPDILTLGKGIGGGVPLTAMLAREEICLFEAGDQGGTFNGNPLMTAVGKAVVDEISKPEFLARVRQNGDYLKFRLKQLSGEFSLGETRGEGLLLALDLIQPIASSAVARALERGLLLNSPRPSVLRFMPALNVSREEMDQMMDILRDAIMDL